MLTSQKHLFSLDPEITYLNNAYRAPILKSSEEAAIQDLIKMRSPHQLKPEDFFSGVERVNSLFGNFGINGSTLILMATMILIRFKYKWINTQNYF